MNKHKKLIELGKSLLIVLLLISAVLLIRQTGYFSAIFGSIPNPSSQQVNQSGVAGAQGTVNTRAVRLFKLVVSSADGTKYVAAYSSDELSDAFGSFSAALGEALGSASSPTEISEAQWRACLTGESVIFDFYYQQPISLLSSWLGTSSAAVGDYSARMLALDCGGNAAWLYFIGGDGNFYRCSTAVSSSALLTRMAAFKKGSASFAFENSSYAGIDPYCMVVDPAGDVSAVSAVSTVGSTFDLDGLFRLLNFNSYFLSQYTESDGTQVYVESGKTLRILPDGSVAFRGNAGSGSATVAQAVDIATELAAQSLGTSIGAAQLCFAGIEQNAFGEYVVSFQYSINGLPVTLSAADGAASVTVSGGAVSRLELYPRCYTLSGEALHPLPVLLAAAIVSDAGGGEPVLTYVDSGASVSCEWTVRADG